MTTPDSLLPRSRSGASRSVTLSRRTLLLGAAAGALAACGGSDGGSGAGAGSLPGVADDLAAGGGSGDVTDTFTLVQRFPNNVQGPGSVRMPITLSTGAAEFIQDGPAQLGAQVVDIDGVPVGERITAVKRDVAPAPYYDFRARIEEPGFYSLVVDGGPADGAAFQVMEAGTVAVPGPGDPLPPFDTPTVDDDQDWASLCTRTPEPCPFHEFTLTEALEQGRHVAYYVGTPAFCSTGSCAPALEALMEAADEFGDTFAIVHVEVFTDDAATVVAEPVTAVGMTYEPAIFLTDADGVVVERLDAVWDRSELAEAMARVAAV